MSADLVDWFRCSGASKADFFDLGLMQVSWSFLGLSWHQKTQRKSHQTCIKFAREVALKYAYYMKLAGLAFFLDAIFMQVSPGFMLFSVFFPFAKCLKSARTLQDT